jgi:hypothetical protein
LGTKFNVADNFRFASKLSQIFAVVNHLVDPALAEVKTILSLAEKVLLEPLASIVPRWIVTPSASIETHAGFGPMDC